MKVKSMPPRVWIVGGVGLFFLVCGTIIFQFGKGPQSSTATAPTPVTTGKTLSAQADTFLGYSPLSSTLFQDILGKSGLELKYSDEFDQKIRLGNLTTGKSDIAFTTLDQYLAHRPKARIVGIADTTLGADGFVLGSADGVPLKTIDDLVKASEKRIEEGQPLLNIVYAAGTPSEFLWLLMAKQNPGLRIENFNIIEVDDASKAFGLLRQRTDIVGAILWEPYLQEAQGWGYSLAFDSSQAKNGIIDVIVASDKIIEENPEKVQGFLDTWLNFVNSSHRNKTVLRDLFASKAEVSPSEALRQLRQVNYLGSASNSQWFNQGILKERIGYVASVLRESGPGRLPQPVGNPEALYTGKFLSSGLSQAPRKAKVIRLFSGNASDLSPTNQKRLDEIAKGKNVSVSLVSHSAGVDKALLSRSQAEVVARYLRSKGVTVNSIQAMGAKQPISGVEPEAPRQQRIDVILSEAE